MTLEVYDKFDELRPVKTPLGSFVRELRRKRGISQGELSRILNVTPGYISRLESGTRGVNPSVQIIVDLIEGLSLAKKDVRELLTTLGVPLEGKNAPRKNSGLQQEGSSGGVV